MRRRLSRRQFFASKADPPEVRIQQRMIESMSELSFKAGYALGANAGEPPGREVSEAELEHAWHDWKRRTHGGHAQQH